jgi:hypothetical protein
MRIFLLILGLVVFGLVLHSMGLREIGEMAQRSGWTIVWMILLYAISVSIRGWVIWRSLPAPRMRLVDTLRIRFAAEAVEMLTFTGPFLAEPAKGFMFIRRGVPAALAAGVIVFENLAYSVVAAGLAIAGLLVLLSRDAFQGRVRGGVIALVWCLSCFTAGVIWASVTGIGLLAPTVRLARPLLGARRTASVVESVASMEVHLLDILHRSPRRFFEALAAESAGHLLLALEILLLFRSLGFHGHRTDPLIVEGGVKFVNTVFVFIPGQFGASEGANALIVGGLGYPAALGVTLSLMRRVRAYVVAAAGLIVAPPR